MPTAQPVAIGSLACGPGNPLLWILGPCVIESHDLTLRIADTLREVADRLGVPIVLRRPSTRRIAPRANRSGGRGCTRG